MSKLPDTGASHQKSKAKRPASGDKRKTHPVAGKGRTEKKTKLSASFTDESTSSDKRPKSAQFCNLCVPGKPQVATNISRKGLIRILQTLHPDIKGGGNQWKYGGPTHQTRI